MITECLRFMWVFTGFRAREWRLKGSDEHDRER